MSNRKPIFFTSDTHYFHANSIKFDNRPFKDLEHMHQVLVNKYNAVVPPSGVCYFLGDVGIGPSGEMKKLINSLNGTKILIRGNHDKKENVMHLMGFDAVLEKAVINIAGYPVHLSHCPLRGLFREDTSNMRGTDDSENWHGESRESHKRLSFQNEGQICLHGHCHKGEYKEGRPDIKLVKDGLQYDIGVCGNNFYPVSISQIESWISKLKIDGLL